MACLFHALPAAPGFCDIRRAGDTVKRTKGSTNSNATGFEDEQRGLVEFRAKPSERCKNRHLAARRECERHGRQLGHFAASPDGVRRGLPGCATHPSRWSGQLVSRETVIETTTDHFLGGRLTLQQPAKGFRAGLDAVVLAAAVPAKQGDHVLELGSGVGTASLCLAARVACSATGVDIDGALVSLALANASNNALDERVRFIEGDVFAPPRSIRKTFAHAFANPPFHHRSDPSSDNGRRKRAMRDASSSPADWLKAGLKRVEPGGTFTLIIRTDRLPELLDKSQEGGFTVLPLWPHIGESAKRVIVQIRKGSRARLALLPGLVLHERDGKFTKEADSILRGRSALHFV